MLFPDISTNHKHAILTSWNNAQFHNNPMLLTVVPSHSSTSNTPSKTNTSSSHLLPMNYAQVSTHGMTLTKQLAIEIISHGNSPLTWNNTESTQQPKSKHTKQQINQHQRISLSKLPSKFANIGEFQYIPKLPTLAESEMTLMTYHDPFYVIMTKLISIKTFFVLYFYLLWHNCGEERTKILTCKMSSSKELWSPLN